jgi:hypothetical protein
MRDQPRTPDPHATAANDDEPAVDTMSRPDRLDDRAAERAPHDQAKEPREQGDKGGIVEMLLREGPDAPDAADIEDPERQR